MPPINRPPQPPRRGDNLRSWLFGEGDTRRFTQDSVVLPRVWIDYAAAPQEPHDLLLTPEARSSAAALARALGDRFEDDGRKGVRLAYNEAYVVARLTLRDLVRVVVPLSAWWSQHIGRERIEDVGAWVEDQRDSLRRELENRSVPFSHGGARGELIWFVGLVGRVGEGAGEGEAPDIEAVISTAAELLAGVPAMRSTKRSVLWRVNPNRAARTTLQRSRAAIKADAATRLFDLSCSTLSWAIVDAGIDATHPAFGLRDASGALVEPGSALHSRVRCTYDFTRLRRVMAGELDVPEEAKTAVRQLEQRLQVGHAIDWDALAPLLRIEHDDSYEPPPGEHGTHVAGILGADWRTGDKGFPLDHELKGICPDIALYDLRVFDSANRGWEFPITAALQFVRHLNAHSDLQVIHGVNLSLAIDHDVSNYACGRTPICDECDRLVGAGVVVVAAAGNEGRAQFTSDDGVTDGYRTTSITDPGNAERVLTVGATHRFSPHMYGVSYFSSRGPTGDGRRKPDLVAPGERIFSPVPDGDAKAKDGTSQAAPHVSGAAALLMARHEELRGQPERIKQVLCAAATDLGREPYFQGAGMLDVLRAIQEV
ncbi:MAG TPA: S8 family serine peptidase [Conexibacter sp.]|nr:S8 family serine peptidase [Conexibacter sp.]